MGEDKLPWGLKRELGPSGLWRPYEGCFWLWLLGYVRKLGVWDSFRAEIWAIVHGLELAWNKGFKFLIVESDSHALISALTSVDNTKDGFCKLSRRVGSLQKHDWQLKFKHNFREGNKCADWIANKGIELQSYDL